MKRLLYLVVVCTVFMSSNAFACAFGSACVDGNAQVEGTRFFGDNAIGGVGYGSSNGFFSGCGNPVSGAVSTNGILVGESRQLLENYYMTSSSLYFNSASNFFGKLGNISVAGDAFQGNWLSLNNDSSFVNGWNSSGATYNGGTHGSNVNFVGVAVANGFTEGYLSDNSVYVKTYGDSTGMISRIADPTAYGGGSISAGLFRNGQNFNAYGAVNGNYSYQAAGPNFAQGQGYTTGSVNFNKLPNGISISSTVKSAASAQGR